MFNATAAVTQRSLNRSRPLLNAALGCRQTAGERQQPRVIALIRCLHMCAASQTSVARVCVLAAFVSRFAVV